jgi:hypothetical protein
MTASRDPDRLIRAFIREGEDDLHDQVYDAVRASIEQKRQRAFIGPWRLPEMNKIVTIGLGAAAVVVALIVGVQLLGSPSGGLGGPADDPTPTAEPTATPEPSIAEPASGDNARLPEGPFSFEATAPAGSDEGGMTLTVTTPTPDWVFDTAWSLLGPGGPEDAPFAAFWVFPGEPFHVPADPCRGDSTRPDTAQTTVDEIAAALAAQASRNASEPVDVTIGGYAGKSLILHAPDDVDVTTCERGDFITYFAGADFWRNVQRPDEVSELWILDVDGTIVIIDAVSSPTNSTELVDETRTAVESTTFEAP